MRIFKGIILAAVLFVAVVFIFGTGLVRQEAQENKTTGILTEKYSTSDGITRDIRDRSKEFYRVRVSPNADRNSFLSIGRVIADYGTIVIVSVDKSMDPQGFSGFDFEKLRTTVHLPNASFEPITDNPESTYEKGAGQMSDRVDGDYYVVQLAGPAEDEWLESFKSLGAEVIQYVSHQSYIVFAGPGAADQLSDHSRVRWIGRYLPEHKVHQSTRDFAEANSKGSTSFDIAVFSREGLLNSRNRIAELPGVKLIDVLEIQRSYFHIVRVEVPGADIGKIAQIRDVFRIDPYVRPEKEDERAAQIVSGNYSNQTTISAPGYNPLAQFGVDGTNVTVSVVDDGVGIPGDGGFYVTAANAIDGPLRGETSGADGHGHLNASIISGDTPFSTLDPTGYNYGSGIAPRSHIINIPLLGVGATNDYTGNPFDTLHDTVTTAGPNGVNGFITNNSWGSGTNVNSYDSFAAAYDTLVHDASTTAPIDPVVVVFSAGNSGGSGLTRPKMAKNVIAVANAENLRTELNGTIDNIDDLSSSSSRGPAADGRIKPDISAPGTGIAGGRSGPDALFGNIDANHRWSAGTSHAAPQVAGVAALFTQFWKNQNAGNNPSPAMVKAAILNTGQEMSGVGTTNPIPNGDEGWGRVNTSFMLNTGAPMKYFDQAVTFTSTGNSQTIDGFVGTGSKPVRVSLVWSDAPGTTDPALVNDLDLTVTIGGTSVYKGNVFTAGSSTTGGTADSLNNVEHVFLPAGIPIGTTFSIKIDATAINGDGDIVNADTTDQNFALVAYNFSDTAVPGNTPFDFDGDSKTDVSIFRPGPGEWWYLRSSDGGNFAAQFGAGTDTIAPADFTGDGKTDIAFFRPTSGEWFVLRSEDNSFFSFPFGTNGDIPVPGDYDGDGMADPAVFRPATSTWFILNSGGGTHIETFGTTGDQPVPADYDGDGKDDIGIYRPSLSEWWINRSQDGLMALQFGASGDQTTPGDFTGDGKDDIAFFRPSNGFWFVLRSEDNSFFSFPFGTTGDIPAPGDYDGDGVADATVFRPSNNTWFKNQSTDGFEAETFGITNDIPVPNAYVTE